MEAQTAGPSPHRPPRASSGAEKWVWRHLSRLQVAARSPSAATCVAPRRHPRNASAAATTPGRGRRAVGDYGGEEAAAEPATRVSAAGGDAGAAATIDFYGAAADGEGDGGGEGAGDE